MIRQVFTPGSLTGRYSARFIRKRPYRKRIIVETFSDVVVLAFTIRRLRCDAGVPTIVLEKNKRRFRVVALRKSATSKHRPTTSDTRGPRCSCRRRAGIDESPRGVALHRFLPVQAYLR